MNHNLDPVSEVMTTQSLSIANLEPPEDLVEGPFSDVDKEKRPPKPSFDQYHVEQASRVDGPQIPGNYAAATPDATAQSTLHRDSDEGHIKETPVDETEVYLGLVDDHAEHDILDDIPSMYRLLDLLYDKDGKSKAVVYQPSISKLLNKMSPGSYESMTKINFRLLDEIKIHPIGIYGSYARIITWLQDEQFISEKLADTLRQEMSLRPGLYLVEGGSFGGRPMFYIVFWPEDSTWETSDTTIPGKNRVAFMRYLSKLCDQIYCLVSDEDAVKISAIEKWNEMQMLGARSATRMFKRKVEKTAEEEETAQAFPGPTHNLEDSFISLINSTYGQLGSPRLIGGNNTVGLSLYYQQPATEKIIRTEQKVPRTHLNFQHILLGESDEKPRLSENIDRESLEICVKNGLCQAFNETYQEWISKEKEALGSDEKHLLDRLEQDKVSLKTRLPVLRAILAQRAGPILRSCFGPFDVNQAIYPFSGVANPGAPNTYDETSKLWTDTMNQDDGLERQLETIFSKLQSPNFPHHPRYSVLKLFWLELYQQIRVMRSATRDWEHLKDILTSESDQSDLDTKLREWLEGDTRRMDVPSKSWSLSAFMGWATTSEKSPNPVHKKLARTTMRDVQFIQLVAKNNIQKMAYLDGAVRLCALEIITEILEMALNEAEHVVVQRHLAKRRRDYELQLPTHAERTTDLVKKINAGLQALNPKARKIITILRVSEIKANSISLTYQHKEIFESSPVYEVWKLGVSKNGGFNLQPFGKFPISDGHTLLQVHFFGSKQLLTIEAKEGSIMVFLHYEGTHTRQRCLTLSNRLGIRPCFALDEAQNLLAVVINEGKSSQLVIYHFTGRQFEGYIPQALEDFPFEDAKPISQMRFVPNKNMLVMIDILGRMALYSLVSQQFRPSGIILEAAPSFLHCPRDGSCIIVGLETARNRLLLQVYHIGSFGSKASGITLDGIEPLQGGELGIFNSGGSQPLHLLSFKGKLFTSVTVKVTSKAKEYSFQDPNTSKDTQQVTHHPLIHCFAEIWNRYPVVPTIEHCRKSEDRKGRGVHFIVSTEKGSFVNEFLRQQREFCRSNQKPTLDRLSSLSVMASSSINLDVDVSQFDFGDWLVGLFCLLPIQLAQTDANVFIPLKDGTRSREFEDRISGAAVEEVANSLSFGWYESVFNSYLANLPVRVISSMGEQSVGKSYALNHFADTSFAGSAMRCTEGVWMSVTPRRDQLLVTMDFEGINSFERTQQEDMFLVLFQTAISNLVLLRSNHSVSQSMAKLLASFQNSAQAFNSEANPNLFQSTLVIVIRDVTDGDAAGIVQEFDEKLAKIVTDEKEGNFMSRLHQGEVVIMPWSVISSPAFYHEFEDIRDLLSERPHTYTSGGEFLSILKMLMAKIMAMDWSGIEKNLGTQRGNLLREHLKDALRYGATKDGGNLTLFDTDQIICATSDTNSIFELADSEDIVAGDNLQKLSTSWNGYTQRDKLTEEVFITELGEYLRELAEERIELVDTWIRKNATRFEDNSDVQELRSEFKGLAARIRSQVILCKMSCLSCGRKCIKTQLHKGIHDCQTEHTCPAPCAFPQDHINEIPSCSLPALHLGRHLCDNATHICGAPCALTGRVGCKEMCSKPIDHSDNGHRCFATRHACGEPCDLAAKGMKQDGHLVCQGKCDIECSQKHDRHCCERAAYCPFRCALCKRLCAERDHLHGLEDGAIHLCGDEHECRGQCEMPGICEVKAEPRKVITKYTGKLETFHFTMYTQEARKLRCQVKIQPGQLAHAGRHHHGNDLHYCPVRCPQCDYYCTLEHGHTKERHVTGHGSMKKTEWMIEDNEETVQNGKRYTTGDSGSTMQCSLYCAERGRHLHLTACRGACQADKESEHVMMEQQEGEIKKCDWITHRLFWERTGFQDPYSQEQRIEFAKCDYYCPDSDHDENEKSYCILPMFHPAADRPSGNGYISHDGHSFVCKNPVITNHIIFVIDRSSSMGFTDKLPQTNLRGTQHVAQFHNNRYGAVLVALYRFLKALKDSRPPQSGLPQDAFSCILFSSNTTTLFSHDSKSSASTILSLLVAQSLEVGTNFSAAIETAKNLITESWNPQERPLIIFLSDGSCSIQDATVSDICDHAAQLGNPLGFYTVTFGRPARTGVLKRMALAARQSYQRAEPQATNIPCQYRQALEAQQLEEVFLDIAESIRDNRAALYRKENRFQRSIID